MNELESAKAIVADVIADVRNLAEQRERAERRAVEISWERAADISRLHARIERLEAALRRLLPSRTACECAWDQAPCPYCQAREALLREERPWP